MKKFWHFDDRNDNFHKAIFFFLPKRLRNISDFKVRHCFRWPLLSQV